jgi:antitoxin component of MazEF toxin-antitoxin module
MAEITFRAPIRPSGRGGGGHLVDVPTEVVEALGGKGRIPVTATFDRVPYRGSIVRMGGGAGLGVQKAIMAEAGVSVGDSLTVVVRNDEGPREVEVPDDLAEALARNAPARAAFPLVLAQAGVRPFDHRSQAPRDQGATHRADDRAAGRAGFGRLGLAGTLGPELPPRGLGLRVRLRDALGLVLVVEVLPDLLQVLSF